MDVHDDATDLIIFTEVLGMHLEPAKGAVALPQTYLGAVGCRGDGPRAVKESPGEGFVARVYPRER